MCGILGMLAADGRSLPSGALDAIELLRHRGPDGEGRYSDGPVALAMRRLAIIDLVTGDQPIANEDGSIVCICNGEIYNYVELRAELAGRGHRFSTSGDVEVIVHLYEELGEGCFERLRGMFGIALWDAGTRRLLLARDRYGIKPLYVADVPDGLAFASELRPLLALGADAGVDVQALADYLSLGYVPGQATGLSGIKALAPGTLLSCERGSTKSRAFATLEPTPGGDLEERLEQAVALHLRADVPHAVLLSGGLDSSLIASFAAQQQGTPLHTFTVGFGDAAFDELGPARLVADAVGSVHHEVAVRQDAAADLPRIVASLEEPLADPSAIPLWYVCRAVAAEMKVALAGEGGDEVFGGYSRYAWDRRAARLGAALPTALLADLLEQVPWVRARASKSERKSVVRRAVKLLRFAGKAEAERYFSWFALYSDDLKAEVLARSGTLPADRVFSQLFAEAPAGLTQLGRLQYVDLRSMLLADLMLKADRMSMAHSLELRVPLLDNDLVPLGLGLPDSRKVRGVETKRALRELVARRLPAAIASRPKQGFEVPINRWLREDLAEMAGDLLSPARLARRNLLEPQPVARLLREHASGAADHGLRLYALLALELWHEEIVDKVSLAVSGRSSRAGAT